MKREATKKVLQAIQAALNGKLFVSDKVSAKIAERFAEGRMVSVESPVEHLSDRELEVFQLLGRGYNTRQIADHLHVGFKTVQAYCARIKEKLKLANINELLVHAVRWHESQATK
jgi:DNA-binding NarL/FixJ family response regulator